MFSSCVVPSLRIVFLITTSLPFACESTPPLLPTTIAPHIGYESPSTAGFKTETSPSSKVMHRRSSFEMDPFTASCLSVNSVRSRTHSADQPCFGRFDARLCLLRLFCKAVAAVASHHAEGMRVAVCGICRAACEECMAALLRARPGSVRSRRRFSEHIFMRVECGGGTTIPESSDWGFCRD